MGIVVAFLADHSARVGVDPDEVCHARTCDVARALGMVDRAATRLPSLGTAAERARARFLADDDGVARLLYEYAPVGRSA